jgi:hypothetical protein
MARPWRWCAQVGCSLFWVACLPISSASRSTLPRWGEGKRVDHGEPGCGTRGRRTQTGRHTHTHTQHTSGRCRCVEPSLTSAGAGWWWWAPRGRGGASGEVVESDWAAGVAGCLRSCTTRGSVPLTCGAGDAMGRARLAPCVHGMFARRHRVRLLSFSHLAKQSKRERCVSISACARARFNRSDEWSRVGTIQRATCVVLMLPPFFFLIRLHKC